MLLTTPAAVFLNNKASAAEFDAVFYAVQLTLMSMNFRDGLKLAGKWRS